jgi:spermidine synthase
MSYIENNIDEFGVSHVWHNSKVINKTVTHRGTILEIVDHDKLGIACYMDNSIQSATVDEKIYHESLVHPVMSCSSKKGNVMIIGGGEGATAREVLKWPDVECVDMFEWDEEVVKIFKTSYPQWGQGAWNDERLHIYYDDIFERIKQIPNKKYDVVIIDLFEPTTENKNQWETLLGNLHNWTTNEASIVMYAGMRNISVQEQPYKVLTRMINDVAETWRGIPINSIVDKDIIPYRVYIPSFTGESMFILLKSPTRPMNFQFSKSINSHLTSDIWNSYRVLNW